MAKQINETNETKQLKLKAGVTIYFTKSKLTLTNQNINNPEHADIVKSDYVKQYLA